MSTIILNNTFKTIMPLINAIVNKTLRQFFPLSGYHSLQFFDCVKFSSVVDSAEGPPNSIVNRIKIGDVWGPHVRLDEISLLFLQIICGIKYCVRWRTILLKMSICVGDILLGYQATDPFPGRIKNSTNY